MMPLNADTSATLIDLAGAPTFGDCLLDAAASLAGIEEVFGYVVDSGGTRPLVSASALDRQALRVSEYSRRFYLQDPAIFDAQSVPVNSGFAQQVDMAMILPHDYRRLCFEEPSFTGKLCFGWRGDSHMLVLNFYSRREADEEWRPQLGSLADIALAALNRRLLAKSSPPRFVESLEARLHAAFPLLAQRERQVVARTIGGWTADAIAADLGTSRGTVLTYRQRAYQKYGFGSTAGFLPDLL